MKSLIISFSFLLPLAAWSNENKDLARLLRESRCIPTRSPRGVVSYKCDGTLGAELKAQKQQGRRLMLKPGLQTQTAKMDLNDKSTGNRKIASEKTPGLQNPADEKIKSCLASIYLNQVYYHQRKGTYSSQTEDMGVDRNETCNGLFIQTHIANDREFKITARFGKTTWIVDQTKTITRVK